MLLMTWLFKTFFESIKNLAENLSFCRRNYKGLFIGLGVLGYSVKRIFFVFDLV